MARLQVRVTPRSKKPSVGVQDGIVRVHVSAAPTDGQANDAVVQALAKALDVRPSAVAIVAGHTSRQKTIEVQGVQDEELRAKLGILEL